MKRSIYIACTVGLLAVMLGCKKDDILLFDDPHELYFEKFFEDEILPGTGSAEATNVSFFFYPDGTQDILAPLVVNLSGKLPKGPIPFGLRVVDSLTTANSNEYTIAPSYTFDPYLGPGITEIKDTIQVQLHRSARLDDLIDGVTLVVELVPNEFFNLGQTERTRAKIVLTTLARQPDWWTTEVTTNLLGPYSQKKFRLFLNEIDKNAEMNGDFIRERPDMAIKMVLQFKTWLNAQSPAILEANGEPMMVAI